MKDEHLNSMMCGRIFKYLRDASYLKSWSIAVIKPDGSFFQRNTNTSTCYVEHFLVIFYYCFRKKDRNLFYSFWISKEKKAMKNNMPGEYKPA